MEINKDIAEIESMMTDFSNKIEVTPAVIQERRERILELEKVLMVHPDSKTPDEYNPGNIEHHFGSGVYGRQLFLSAGVVVISKIHKEKTLNVIAKGLVSVIDPVRGFNTYQAPYVFVSEPMTKRIVIAHEDTLWITSHANPTNTENLDELEENIIAKHFNGLEKKENLCLGGQPE